MSSRPPSDLTRIGQVISESMSSGFLGLAKEMVRVFEVWTEAVGTYNAARSKPISIKNGRLTVQVASSVWIDHFSYLKGLFIEKINQALGAPVVKEIVFQVGSIPESEATKTVPDTGRTPQSKTDDSP